MTRRFKNALCLHPIPDWYGGHAPCCRRRRGHLGRHRVVFRDGGVREWNSADLETELTKESRDG